MEGRHYRRRVILPRRIKADLVDGAIATAIMFGPVLAGQGLAGVLSDSTLRLFVLGIPGGFGYSLFRDSVGGGTSLGKRALGLQLIRLEDGKPCGPGRVWARNLLDLIPVIDFVDFAWMCVDKHGQKLMDRKLQTQVVEVDDPEDAGAGWAQAVPRPVRRFPPWRRRVAIMVIYSVVSALVIVVAVMMTISPACCEADRCTPRDEEVVGMLTMAWIVLLVVIGVTGSFGRLWGARRRKV